MNLHPSAFGGGNFPWTSGPLGWGGARPHLCRCVQVCWEHCRQPSPALGVGHLPLVKAGREISTLDAADSGQVCSHTLLKLDPDSLGWWQGGSLQQGYASHPVFALSLCFCTQLKIMAARCEAALGQGTGTALCVCRKPDSSSCSSLSVTQAASAAGSDSLWMLTGYRNKQALLMPLASLDFLVCLCIFSLRTRCPQGWRGPVLSHTFDNV